jgi:putative acetyltransferase
VDKLVAENVAFFVLWCDGQAAGCGGVRLYDDYAELKRMYVRPAFRGRGLARQMLLYLIDFSRQAGRGVIRLETGIHQTAAIRLYEGMGFRQVAPFGEYFVDPLSRCYELVVSD